MTARAVFFDLDGTLTDPKLGFTRCIQHAMERLGRIPSEADDLHWCIGPPLRASFTRLLESAEDESELLAHGVTRLARSPGDIVGLVEALFEKDPET